MSDLDRTERFIILGLKALGLKTDDFGTFDVDTEHESDTEAWINLNRLGVSVFVDAEGTTRKTIGGGEVKTTGWQVYTIKHLPATRQEPEDTDFVFRGEFDNMAEAVAEVFALVARDRILNMIESVGEADDQTALEEAVG